MMDDMFIDSGVNLLVGAIFFITHEKLAVVCHAYEDLLKSKETELLFLLPTSKFQNPV